MNDFPQADFEKVQENSSIWSMMNLLGRAGRDNFSKDAVWEKCLCALVVALRPKANVRQILEALPGTSAGMDELDMLNTMAHLGYSARTVQAKLSDIDRRLLPCLLIAGEGKPFIVLGETASGQLKFYDPDSLIVTETPPEDERAGRLWFFELYDEHKEATSKFIRAGSGHHWFRALLGRFSGTFAQVMAAGLMLNFVALGTPLFIMLVYDRVIAASAPDILPMITLGALLAIGFEWVLRRIRSQGLSWLAGRLDNMVGNKIFAHLIGLPPSLIETASVASQIARIKTFESVRDFFSGSVFLSLLELPFVIVAVMAIAFVAGPLVFVPLGIAVLYMGLFWIVRSKVKLAIRLAAKTSSARQQFTIESFEKIEGIRAHGLEKKWQEKFRHLSGREMIAHFHLNFLGMVAETAAHALTVMAAVATIGFGAHLVWAGGLSTGALVATMILVWRVLTPFYSLCTMIPRLEQLRNSVIQVNKLIEMDTEEQLAKSASRLPQLKGTVSFDHVALRYETGRDAVFSGLSFKVPPGGFLAVTGNNGTGKTSVLKLIKGLYPTSEGAVRIDGFDIRQLDAPDLRRQIAYVPQKPDFFHGEIAENLRFANPLAGDDEIEKALKLADAWEEIEKMPEGLHTVIDANSLTGALRIKLSLARAYLQQSRIVLIDELPGAFLSTRAGHNLKAYLERIRGQRTVIMGTCRDDFLQGADFVVTLRGKDAPVYTVREESKPPIESKQPAQASLVREGTV
ncbi:MAG: peptidase domain-containing ABC transporter [Alphaproteobacteria bacterium]|nr:peptidase domain-containing ABC transporter [Alphaproteobacteria bacterium]